MSNGHNFKITEYESKKEKRHETIKKNHGNAATHASCSITGCLAASQSVEVQAAAKTVLKNKYYGYENGKRVRNQWRTIKVGNRSFRFYFDKNGRAYHADRNYVGTTGIVVKKLTADITALTIRDT